MSEAANRLRRRVWDSYRKGASYLDMICRDYDLEGLRRQAVVCAVGTGQPKMLVLSSCLPRLLPDQHQHQ